MTRKKERKKEKCFLCFDIIPDYLFIYPHAHTLVDPGWCAHEMRTEITWGVCPDIHAYKPILCLKVKAGWALVELDEDISSYIVWTLLTGGPWWSSCGAVPYIYSGLYGRHCLPESNKQVPYFNQLLEFKSSQVSVPLEVRAKRHFLDLCSVSVKWHWPGTRPRFSALPRQGRGAGMEPVGSLLFSEEQLQGEEVNAEYFLLLLWLVTLFGKPKPLRVLHAAA